ncbi:hypothetical protein TFLX_05221 [Thermoflexales bacterium]|nr:hypothetical protein TFLX_05221 [Thermoflexales bacterium]
MERQSLESLSSPRTKRREKLLWLATLLLALLVVCSGCGFFFTVGLLSRGELTANVLGAEWRLWRINEKRETGLGFDRAFETRRAARSCTQHYTTIVLWKPSLSIDNLAYDDCG